jgi:hypothetical protein
VRADGKPIVLFITTAVITSNPTFGSESERNICIQLYILSAPETASLSVELVALEEIGTVYLG